MILSNIFLIVIGLSGGLSVGCGFVAFLSVLGIIPRLSQLTKTHHFIREYEWSVVLSVVFGTWVGLRNTHFHLSYLLLIPIGIGAGIFVGLLAAALTEVLNVLPILAKRIGIHEQILLLLMAIVLGKVFGSLFHWSLFINK